MHMKLNLVRKKERVWIVAFAMHDVSTCKGVRFILTTLLSRKKKKKSTSETEKRREQEKDI